MTEFFHVNTASPAHTRPINMKKQKQVEKKNMYKEAYIL